MSCKRLQLSWTERLPSKQRVAGSNPARRTTVLSRDIEDTRTLDQGSGFLRLRGLPVGVERELAEELAGGGVDDADVQVLDQHVDGGPGVGSADADVVEAAVVAEGELAVGVDAVGADAVVGVG